MGELIAIIQKTIFPMLSPAIANIIKLTSPAILGDAKEIRLRSGQPLMIGLSTEDVMLDNSGQPVKSAAKSYIVQSEDLMQTLQLISKNSLYAYEEEMKLGFLTISGGHRIGLAGQVVTENGQIKALKSISSMNIRIANEVKGCSDKIIPFILEGGRVLNTLIISPPRCGKTTLLRDIVRQISNGVPALCFAGTRVGVVDERSEIAACEYGVPTVDLGPRTDVLDACPKAGGMIMLMRSMSPHVIIADEIGRAEDTVSIKEALNAGVGVITTVHGRNALEIAQRPTVGELIQNKYFDRYIILNDSEGPGTIERVIRVANSEVLFKHCRGAKICG